MKTQEEDLISLVALYVIMIYTSISLKQNRLLLSWLIIIQQHIPLYSTTGRNAICFLQLNMWLCLTVMVTVGTSLLFPSSYWSLDYIANWPNKWKPLEESPILWLWIHLSSGQTVIASIYFMTSLLQGYYWLFDYWKPTNIYKTSRKKNYWFIFHHTGQLLPLVNLWLVYIKSVMILIISSFYTRWNTCFIL